MRPRASDAVLECADTWVGIDGQVGNGNRGGWLYQAGSLHSAGSAGGKYAIRIPTNDSLERDRAELLPRPVGRPSQKQLEEYRGFRYQAASWKMARRVGAKIVPYGGDWFSRMGSMVTNATLPSQVVLFESKRGTAEVTAATIKEGKPDVKMTRLSCHRFRSNEVWRWLSVTAHDLGNRWRRLLLRKTIGHWLLISLQ